MDTASVERSGEEESVQIERTTDAQDPPGLSDIYRNVPVWLGRDQVGHGTVITVSDPERVLMNVRVRDIVYLDGMEPLSAILEASNSWGVQFEVHPYIHPSKVQFLYPPRTQSLQDFEDDPRFELSVASELHTQEEITAWRQWSVTVGAETPWEEPTRARSVVRYITQIEHAPEQAMRTLPETMPKDLAIATVKELAQIGQGIWEARRFSGLFIRIGEAGLR